MFTTQIIGLHKSVNTYYNSTVEYISDSFYFFLEKKSMTKKKGGKTKESKGNKVEVNPDESDPLILFKHYNKHCSIIGIPVSEAIKAALLSDSPNVHCQLLLGPKEKNKSSTNIGDGDCRALMHAILGNEENDSFKYTYSIGRHKNLEYKRV